MLRFFLRVVVRENDRNTQDDDFSYDFMDLRYQKNHYIRLLVVIFELCFGSRFRS